MNTIFFFYRQYLEHFDEKFIYVLLYLTENRKFRQIESEITRKLRHCDVIHGRYI